MSEERTERNNGRIIATYIPVFKDKLAKLERRGRGSSEEAQRLRITIALVGTTSFPEEAEEDGGRLLRCGGTTE